MLYQVVSSYSLTRIETMEYEHPHIDDEDLRMLPTNRVLDLLGISRTTLHRMVKDGDFPQPIVLRKRTLFSNLEIRVWLDRQLDSRAESKPKKRREIDDLA